MLPLRAASTLALALAFAFAPGAPVWAQSAPPAASSIFREPAVAAMAEGLAQGNPTAALLGRAQGASVDARGRGGWRPIHYVTRYAHERSLASLRSLISAGADVSAADDEGRTPLGLAAARSDAEAAKILLGSGADPKTPSAGRLPLQIAMASGNRAAFEALAVAGSPLMGAPYERGGAAADLTASGRMDWALWLAQRGLVNARSQPADLWSRVCSDSSPAAASLRQILSAQAGAAGCAR